MESGSPLFTDRVAALPNYRKWINVVYICGLVLSIPPMHKRSAEGFIYKNTKKVILYIGSTLDLIGSTLDLIEDTRKANLT